MIARFLQFFASHFLILFCTSVVLGLVLPGIDRIPPEVLGIYMALTIFISSFKVNLEEISEIPVKTVLIFYGVRFVLFPIVLFWVVVGLSESLAVAILLLAVMPAGATSPAFSTIMNGNVSLSLLLVVISSILAPFLAPFLLEILTANIITIDTFAVFISMILIIICPLLLHLPFRRSSGITKWINKNNSVMIMPLIALTIMVVIAKQRDYIFSHLDKLLFYLTLTCFCYFIFYAIAWMLSGRSSLPTKISISLASGLNNITLGIVLAQLYFPADITTFMVLSNVAWIGILVFCPWWVTKAQSKSS